MSWPRSCIRQTSSKKLFSQGWKAEDTSQAALAQRIQSDTTLYGALIAKKGIKLEKAN